MTTRNRGGRAPGLLIYAAAFEGFVKERGTSKREVAERAGVSPSFLSDLLACRGGATRQVADRIAAALRCDHAREIFPELDGWVGPLPDRNAKRAKAA